MEFYMTFFTFPLCPKKWGKKRRFRVDISAQGLNKKIATSINPRIKMISHMAKPNDYGMLKGGASDYGPSIPSITGLSVH